ncbi:MAG: methylated-DNA--[protein]-cysteine S-methyltransferase [Acidimicrobiia bacterium]
MFESEFGKGWIRGDDGGVPNHIALPGSGEPPGAGAETVPPAGIAEVIAQIAAALEGNPTLGVGDDYVDRAARTPLDLAIYVTVAAIPPGETVTYAEVARRVGRPGAARAVGAAMARNPFPPLIPCHRVVGADGSLRGYAGGLALKRRLLGLEEGNATE